MAQRGRPAGRQRFSLQKGGQKKQTMREFREFIDSKAGGDGEALVEAWLDRQDHKIVGGRSLSPFECIVRQSQCFQRMLEGVAKLANRASDYKKRQFYSIFRYAGISRELLNSYGINVGERGACCARFFFFFFFGR